MSFRKTSAIVLIASALCIPVCNSTDASESDERLGRIADLIIAKMTLEEKAGQLIHVGVPGKKMSPSIAREIEKYKVGGVILFAINMGSDLELRSFNKALQDKSVEVTGIPLLLSVDQEGGRVVRVTESVLQFPGAMAAGQTGEPELAYEYAVMTGYELKGIGFNTVFAPTLDINNNPANPVINTRSFGSTKDMVTKMGLAYAEGLRDANSLGTIKHFPGHGDTNVDSHYDLPVIQKDRSQLEVFELIPFQKAIEDGAEGVMTTHILFPKIDSKYPATLSPEIIGDMLRKELKFDGLVFTDAMEMKAIADRYPQGRAAVLALKAGVDVILLTAQTDNTRKSFEAILQAVKSKELSESRINESVKRQLVAKLRLGAFSSGELRRFVTDENLLRYYTTFKVLKEKIADAKYREIRRKYEQYPDGLNTVISRKSIVSARKGFEGLSKSDHTYIFYRTNAVRKQALSLNIPEDRVIFTPSVGTLLNRLNSGKYKGNWLVEFDHRQVASWNTLAVRWDRLNPDAKNKLVGLYSSNPFFNLAIPDSGALLLSFSPTVESRKALVYRAMKGPVEKADLIFSKQ